MSHKLLSAALCCVSLTTLAEEANTPAVESPYTASAELGMLCLLYTSPSPRDLSTSRMPSSA